MKNSPFIALLCGLIVLPLAFSCKKFSFTNDPSDKLAFSHDTVIFDTVFTTIGSVTNFVKVYNPHPESILISSISLAGAENSYFRLNIDGDPAMEMTNIEIRPLDSIFIFVEVTIDPNSGNNPLIVTDSILFETNGNFQDVDLVAWGQDANFLYPNAYIPGFPSLHVLECNSTWDATKPWVIYGYAFVDSLCTLTINEGTQVHFHKNSGIWVYRGGSLNINGTLDKEVVLQGDRLEWDYDKIPGQWDRIWINEGSQDININYAVIKNGFIGIQAESWPFDNSINSATNTININNTIIENMSGMGVFVRNHNVRINNSLISNAGSYLAGISGGGSAVFKQVSLANYWTSGSRNKPSLYVSNFYEDLYGIEQIKTLDSVVFGNCLVYGNQETELSWDEKTNDPLSFVFDHCIIKMEELPSDLSRFSNCVFNPANPIVDGVEHDPCFLNPSNRDFTLFDQSAAIDMGSTQYSSSILFDLKGDNRNNGTNPDLGCYEFIP